MHEQSTARAESAQLTLPTLLHHTLTSYQTVQTERSPELNTFNHLTLSAKKKRKLKTTKHDAYNIYLLLLLFATRSRQVVLEKRLLN